MERETPVTDELFQRAALRERLAGSEDTTAEEIAGLFDFRDLVEELDRQQTLGAEGVAAAPFSEGFAAKYQEDVAIITGNLAEFEDDIESEIQQDELVSALLGNRTKEGYVQAIRIRRSLMAGALYTLAQPACDVHDLVTEEVPDPNESPTDLLNDIPA